MSSFARKATRPAELLAAGGRASVRASSGEESFTAMSLTLSRSDAGG